MFFLFSVCGAPRRDEAEEVTLQLCQCMIDGAGREGLLSIEFTLVLLLASRAFRLSPATKTAFIISLFVLSASPALMFSPQHTIAHNIVLATTDERSEKPEPLCENIGCAQCMVPPCYLSCAGIY